MSRKDRKAGRPSIPVPPVVVPAWKLALGWAFACWAVFVALKFDAKWPGSIDESFRLIESFLSISPVKYLNVVFPYFKSVTLVSAITIGAAGWGSRLIPREPEAEIFTPIERLLLSTGLGFIILSTLVFLLGLIKDGYRPFPFWVFTLVFVGAGIGMAQPEWPAWSDLLREFKWTWIFRSPANFLTFALTLLVVVMAFVPELFYDSLVYHVGLPQMYVNEGRIVDTAHVYFSRFPMLMHMLYVVGLGLDTCVLAKLFNSVMLIVGMGALAATCRRLGWPKGGVWAALLTVAIPVTQLNVWSTAVDSAMGTYTVLAFLAFLAWSAGGYAKQKVFWVFAILIGGVFSVKYTGVVVVLAFGAMLPFCRPLDRPWLAVTKNLFAFGLLVFLVMSPWLVRNYIWTGNPTYPILSSVFKSRNLNVQKANGEQGQVARLAPKSVAEFLEFPWMITMLELSSFNFVGPLTLSALPAILLIPWRTRRDLWLPAAATVLYFLLALHFSGDIRYLLPGIFLLSVWIAGGIHITHDLKPAAGLIARIAFLLVACYQAAWVMRVAQGNYDPAPVVLGAVSPDDYSAVMHPGLNLWPWNPIKQDLKNLPEPCRVYMLGNEQVYGFPKRFWYSSVHDDTPLVIWSNEAVDAEGLYKKLMELGFTHILIDAPEAVRLKGYDIFPWTRSGRNNFIAFANRHLQLIDLKPIANFKESLFLFEIKEKIDRPNAFGEFGAFFKDVLNLGQS